MERLIVFSRYPEAGRTKTRLIPALGPDGAASLQRQFTEKVVRAAQTLQAQRPQVEIWVYFAGGNRAAMQAWLGPGNYSPQANGDLGARLLAAFCDAWVAGCERAIAIGIDCLEIQPATLERALDCLQSCDVVLGPAIDGGYYTIGLRSDRPELFAGIDWGSERVLGQTLHIARNLQLATALLEYKRDCDRPGDLWALPSDLLVRSPG